MKRWLKSRWCAITGHIWIVVSRPRFPNSGLYCQRCEQVRLKDREDRGAIWIGDHRSTKKFRRTIPRATAIPRKE